jgi:hypothetical protein
VEPTSSSNKETIIAIKTFVDAVALPASDINTYLTNSGLVYIKQQTIGTAVASVSVSSAFSTDFDNYRIIITGMAASATAATRFQLSNSTGSTYATSGWIFQYGGAFTSETATAQTAALIGHCVSTGITTAVIEVQSPFLSTTSSFTGLSMSNTYGDDRRSFDSSTNSSTGFVFSALSGTITGGTITVFGYRKS